MRRLVATLILPALLLLPACARPGTGASENPGPHEDAFDRRAIEVAEAWRTSAAATGWRTGFVPLQDATVLVGDPKFTNDTKQAFLAGWYRDQVRLPTRQPAPGTIRFPDGTLTVPLLSADEAYRQLDQSDPPPCPAGRPRSPEPATTDPNGTTSTSVRVPCIPLTVTAVRLDTVEMRTSRGVARVPAWLFTVEELAAPVARLAVAPSAVTPVPEISAPPAAPIPGLVTAQDLAAVDGTRLTYRLGLGACDTNLTPLVREESDVVVVGGTVTQTTGICTDQLLIRPVTVTLDAPLGARPVFDAVTGRPLSLTHGQ